MKTFAVIGLGRFGRAVAKELCELGNEVIAVDVKEENVQSVAGFVTYPVTADARDPEVLRSLAVRNFDCAVVAVASDITASTLITLNLKEQGVKNVVCKAQSSAHQRVLEKIGADRVIFPENEMGAKLAHSLSSSKVLNFVELSDEAGMVEIPVPRRWAGQTLRELDVRKNHGVNVIALRRGAKQKLDVDFDPDTVLLNTDALVLVGRDKDINRVQAL